MLTLSIGDMLVPHAVTLGWPRVLGATTFGAFLVYLLDRVLAWSGLADKHSLLPLAAGDSGTGAGAGAGGDLESAGHAAARYRSALLTAVALAAHNAPEGLAVGLTAMQPDSRHLALVALSIALHNIPEGLAVAAALFHAVPDRTRAVVVATCTGLVEPFAALLSVIFFSGGLSQAALDLVSAAVAGVMACVSVRELLPQAFAQDALAAVTGLLAGLTAMAGILRALNDDA